MLGLDFDGTLAPIVADPDAARVSPNTLGLLSELSRCLRRVVVISGRDTATLAGRLPVDGLVLVGNHGLEEREGDGSRVVPAARTFVPALERAADAVARLPLARAPGVEIERKRASLSVHFRNAADPSAARAPLGSSLEAIAEREGLRLQPGRLVWELRPPIEVDKGQVLRHLEASLHPAAIVYAGDDLTDVDAFRALKTMARVQTVAVGVRSAEVPAAAFADCDLIVDGGDGIDRLLREILAWCQ